MTEHNPGTYISGRRAVAEALRAGHPIEKIFIEFGVKSNGIGDIVKLAKEQSIPLSTASKDKFKKLIEESGAGTHAQGVIALATDYRSCTLEELFDLKPNSSYPLVVAVDGITDPHNLGAIARTAACVGAQGLIIPIAHSSPITPVTLKTAAGAFEYLSVVKVNNLYHALDVAKKHGYWIVGTDATAKQEYTTPFADRALIVVVGSEGRGMRSSISKCCDITVHIPLAAGIESLNASVAAGVILFEIQRQRAALLKTKTP